jgi:hypothetical protein
MTEQPPRTTLPWVCPVCTDRIDVSMWWEQSPPPSFLRVRKIDDIDARMHMEWHRLCTCHWHPADDGESMQRHQAPDCEMHP